MKKLTVVLIAFLVAWNLYLTQEVMTLKQQSPVAAATSTKIVREVVTTFTTDITQIVADVSNKVVGISSLAGGRTIGTGSGFIYEVNGQDALIVTNNHVVASAAEVSVRFANGEEKKAEILGTDLYSDLAILKTVVDFDISPLKIGDSAEVKIGEVAIAIGNPLGFEFQGSTTQGIISGKDRVLGVDLDGDGIQDWDMTLLQTDAAINPGNSGGPLINAAGEVIGINSLKIIQSQVEGFGFAIPVNEMVPIVDQLKQYGKVQRPTIGISARAINEMNYFERSYYGVATDAENGLYIIQVIEGSPAYQAGMRTGDILILFDGIKIDSFKEFRKQLYSKKINQKVEIEYSRKDKVVKTTITLS